MKIKINSLGQNKLLFFPIVFFLIVEGGCCLNEKENYLPNKVKEYCHFKEGSYWVYKSEDGYTDTTIVISSIIDFEKLGAESCENSERLKAKYYSSLFGNLYVNVNAILVSENNCISQSIPWNKEILQLYTYFLQNNTNDTIIVGAEKLYDIYKIDAIDTSVLGSNYKTYFFAKDRGIVRKVDKNGKIWELVDYKINK